MRSWAWGNLQEAARAAVNVDFAIMVQFEAATVCKLRSSAAAAPYNMAQHLLQSPAQPSDESEGITRITVLILFTTVV